MPPNRQQPSHKTSEVAAEAESEAVNPTVCFSTGVGVLGNYTNSAVPLGDFVASLVVGPIQVHQDKKSCRGFSPALLADDRSLKKLKEGDRSKNLYDENVKAIGILVFDIDSKDQVDDPEVVQTNLCDAGWADAGHSSHSNSPEKPKFRVIIPCLAPYEFSIENGPGTLDTPSSGARYALQQVAL